MTSESRIRVRYAETDQMGVAYHANYLIWMEVARVDLCEAAGIRYRDLERNFGVLLAVTEANCRYSGSARYDDEVVVSARIAKSSRRGVTFEYEMRVSGSDQVIATGHTSHIFLNRQMRPASLPEQFRDLFRSTN